MLLPVLLLGAGVVGWIIMVQAALADPSVAIEPNYYQQATHIDREKALLARSAELGWTATVESFDAESDGGARLSFRLIDREGRGLEGLQVSAIAFPNARASDRQKLDPTSGEPGRYSARLARARFGIWEIRLVAERGEDVFHTTLRHELVPPRGRP